MNPMTLAQVQAMQRTIGAAWRAAATEHCVPHISFLYTERQPYLTTYDSQQCDCRYDRILSDLYVAAGEPRTAQAFLCCMPGDPDDAGIDTINVHAPSGRGKRQLQDWQRLELLTTLLQSKSMSRPFGILGEAKFLIGGDKNTLELDLRAILSNLTRRGILCVEPEVFRPTWGLPGDICVTGGFKATLATGQAQNHDPKHLPYGICWSNQAEPTTHSEATNSLDFHSDAARPATEQLWLPCDLAAASSAEECRNGVTRPASEQSEEDLPEEEIPLLKSDGQQLLYAIVNAFLDDLTFENAVAELVIKQAVVDEIPNEDTFQNIDELFTSIFFYFPNGIKDQTTWKPVNTGSYIQEWRRIEEFGKLHSKACGSSPQNIFHQYIQWFIDSEANRDQKRDTWNKNKSRAEARLNRTCGSRHVAFAIWQVGLPDTQLPSFAAPELLATEQQQKEEIAQATQNVLNWLDMLAHGIRQHKQTSMYQTSLRKSGSQLWFNGLTVTELEAKELKKRLRYARLLDRQYASEETQMWPGWKLQLLEAFWNGSLEHHLQELQTQVLPAQKPTMATFTRR